jgi:hypothetical protein
MSSKNPTVTVFSSLHQFASTSGESKVTVDAPTIPSGLWLLTLPKIASPMYGRKTISRNSAVGGRGIIGQYVDRGKKVGKRERRETYCGNTSIRRRTSPLPR